MTNYVRTAKQSIVSNIVKRAVSNLTGGVSSSSTSDFSKLNRGGKGSINAAGLGGGESYETMAFPIDVLSDPNMGNHGHYIQFFVNEQDRAKIKFHEPPSGASNLRGYGKSMNLLKPGRKLKVGQGSYARGNQNDSKGGYVPSSDDFFSRKIAQYGLNGTDYKGLVGGSYQDAFNEEQNQTATVAGIIDKSANQSFRTKRHATTRSKMCINMYMPAQVQVNYGANYTDTTIGALSQQAMDAFNEIMNNNFEGFGETVANMSEAGKEMLLQLMTTTVGTLGPMFGGLEETRQMKSGAIIADKMELAFKGVPKRNFQYTFKMMPRSEQESNEVQRIVKAFKQNMLPETVNANSRQLVVPNTFNIQYMYVNDVNNYLHKIGECVLETMNVSYGGDRYKTFTANAEGAPPVETTMTLNFKEFHFLTRTDIMDGA